MFLSKSVDRKKRPPPLKLRDSEEGGSSVLRKTGMTGVNETKTDTDERGTDPALQHRDVDIQMSDLHHDPALYPSTLIGQGLPRIVVTTDHVDHSRQERTTPMSVYDWTTQASSPRTSAFSARQILPVRDTSFDIQQQSIGSFHSLPVLPTPRHHSQGSSSVLGPFSAAQTSGNPLKRRRTLQQQHADEAPDTSDGVHRAKRSRCEESYRSTSDLDNTSRSVLSPSTPKVKTAITEHPPVTRIKVRHRPPPLEFVPTFHDMLETPLKHEPRRTWTPGPAYFLRQNKLILPKPYPPPKKFSLMSAFLKHEPLLMTLVSYMTIPSVISLYAISKPFHYIFNCQATAFILANMRTWAPNADVIFPWRCYPHLCIKDPIKRQKSRRKTEPPLDETEMDLTQLRLNSRDVPSLRWLQMVTWREGVSRDMIIQLMTKALHVPPKPTLDGIKRTWFITDLRSTVLRKSCFRSRAYLPDKSLAMFIHFLLKVDMSFTDPNFLPYPVHPAPTIPVAYNYPASWSRGVFVSSNLRENLLREPNAFTCLWRVLRGWTWDADKGAYPLDEGETLRLWVRHEYQPPPAPTPGLGEEDGDEDEKGMPTLGIKAEDVGTVGLEKRVLAGRRRQLLGVDELAIRESIRRGLPIGKLLVELMFSGFCDAIGRPRPVLTEEEIYRRERDPNLKVGGWGVGEKRLGELWDLEIEREEREGAEGNGDGDKDGDVQMGEGG